VRKEKEAVLLLKTSFISGQESVEVMEQCPVEDRPFRMSRAIGYCHSGRMVSRNRPTSPMKPDLSKKKITGFGRGGSGAS